jgi:glycosyltransferase
LKVSIITTVKNNECNIEKCILSVINQTYNDIEYIIIDGKSTDKTLDVIKKYKNKINILLSEHDTGIYAGLNRGISLASGDIIALVHSDDEIYDKHVVADTVKFFNTNVNTVGLYGDLIYTKSQDTSKIIRYWKSKQYCKSDLKLGWMPPHTTLYLRKCVYDTLGNFDEQYSISADYDFIIRVLSTDLKIQYIPRIFCQMRLGGVSNRSLKSLMIKANEDYHVLRKNKITGLVIIIKMLRKIPQFIHWKRYV